MTFKRLWQFGLSFSFGGAALLAWLLVVADPFYLHGRKPEAGADVSFYDNERLFKFWLAQKFVPGAFETIILGPSYTASLDPASVPGAEGVYNLSFRGANSVEMLQLGEAVAKMPESTRRTRWAFLCLDPYILKSANPRTGDTDPATFRMTYGSWPVLSLYVQRLVGPLNPLAKFFNRYGANNEYAYLEGGDSSAYIQQELTARKSHFAAPFRAKEVALENFRQLLSSFQAAGIRTVVFQPPKPAALKELRPDSYEAFFREILPKLGPMDRFLNLATEPGLQLDDSYFLDAGGHLSDKGSRWLLSRLLEEQSRFAGGKQP